MKRRKFRTARDIEKRIEKRVEKIENERGKRVPHVDKVYSFFIKR